MTNNSLTFDYSEPLSELPCYIDKLPPISTWWSWLVDTDPKAGPYPGSVEALAQFLQEYNYHDFVNLPYAFKTIIEHTPLKIDEKQVLLDRLCTALYNFDILRGEE